MLSRRNLLLTSVAAGALFSLGARAQAAPDTEWRHYANDLANTRYVPFDQINAANFSRLEVVWRFKTENLGPRPEYQYECTPLMIGGWIYATAGSRRAVACLKRRDRRTEMGLQPG